MSGDRDDKGDQEQPVSKFWGPAENLIFRAADGTVLPHPSKALQPEGEAKGADQGGQSTDTAAGNG